MAAQDRDNDPLTYGISGQFAYFFNVIPTTGEVKLASPLDYEVKGSSLGRPRQGGGEVGALPVLPPQAGAHLGPLLSAPQTLYLFAITISVSDSHNNPVSWKGGGEGRVALGSESRRLGALPDYVLYLKQAERALANKN